MNGDSKYLETFYQQFIHKSRYARYRDDLGRRENWGESVDRYIDFFKDEADERFPELNSTDPIFDEIKDYILNVKTMPSMRCMMTAGKALKKTNMAGFNCAYRAIDEPKAFDEILYILMCGTGAGFSVERQYVNKLPEVPDELYPTDTVIKVRDSKLGWCVAFRELITLLYNGHIPSWDVSKIRPKGARLKTFGGRAAGSDPLVSLFQFTIDLFKKAAGRKLSSLECHDLVCKVADIVVVGGVRRCLTGNTFLSNNQLVKDVKSGDYIETGGKKYKVIAAEYTGKKKVLKIKHRFGNEIQVTPEHRMAVFNGIDSYEFKPAGELQVGDRLVWDGYGYEDSYTKLPSFENNTHFNAKEIKFPEVNTEDFSWLIGLIHGNGHITDRGIEITFHTEHYHVAEKAQNIFNDLCGVNPPISNGHGNCVRLRVHSTALSEWFLKNVKEPNKPIKIPEFILNAPKNMRAAYLAGVFDSDGRSREDGMCEQATTIYETFKDGVTYLLSSLGIGYVSKFRSSKRRRSNGEKSKDFYTIKVSGNQNRTMWTNLVGKYCVSGKQERISIGSNGSPYDFSYPVSFFETKPKGYKPYGNVTIMKVKDHKSLYYPTPIVSIVEGDIEDTYDLEIDDIHQFTANGLVVHNSALISLSNLSDDRMRNAKNGQWWNDNPQRALSNNSVAYTETPDIETYMKEWLSLVESKSGERGIFNAVAAKEQVKKTGRRDAEHDFRCNPCCFTGDMRLLTKDGYKTFNELKDKNVEIVNKDGTITLGKVWSSGVREVVAVHFSHKSPILCTPDHIFMLNDETECRADQLEGKQIKTYSGTDEYVTEVKKIPSEEVFDFTEPETHWGVVENCVVHNSEILLRSSQTCNLSEVILRDYDTYESIKEKIRIATIIGTMQSSLTNFKYLSKNWRRNAEEEALLGVSLTGIMDHPVLNHKWKDEDDIKRAKEYGFNHASLEDILDELREYAVTINEEWAPKIGVNQSTAITCVKPSGCRPANALITTQNGIYTLEDLLVDYNTPNSDWSDINDDIRSVNGDRVTKTFINGKSPTKIIKMSFGMEVQSTPNHQWSIIDEEGNEQWKRADEIQSGERLKIVPDIYHSTEEAALLSLNPNAIHCRTDANESKQPTRMNPDLAWLLGYLWGDGSMSPGKYRLRWIDARENNLEKTQRILKEQFNLDSKLHLASQNRKAKTLEVGSKLLWHWLIKNGVWKYYNGGLDVIPKVVRTSSKESIIAFLGGLIDADGWASDEKLTYTTSYEDFSKHIQDVAWTVGIALGRSKNIGGKNLQKKKEMYLMSLLGGSVNTSLSMLVRHCDKAKETLIAFNPKRTFRYGIVKEVVDGDVINTYDVETESHWFYGGAVKSHNTVSQLVNSSSGIHARYAPYYLRSVRADSKDPLATFMIREGFPYEVDVMNPHNYVFYFPIKSPANSVSTEDRTAIEELEFWSLYNKHWAEHKPSVTINVKEDEWMRVGSWVWDHFSELSGVSFLPYDGHSYQQAPYQPLSEEQYHEWVDSMPTNVDWEALSEFENETNAENQSREYACSAGACEI